MKFEIKQPADPVHQKVVDSLGAPDECTQPIFYERFVNQTKCIKETVVSYDVTGGITLEIKLKMSIFTLCLPHNLQSWILVFQKIIYLEYYLEWFQIYQHFCDKKLVRPGSKYLF